MKRGEKNEEDAKILCSIFSIDTDDQLSALEQDKDFSLSKDNEWKGSFVHLREYDEKGDKIAYSLIEKTQLQGYKNAIASEDGKFIVRNIADEKVSIPVEKRWIGKSLEEATINLIADGTKINTVTLNEDNGWKHIFEDLSQYDSRDGHEIVYTVAEEQVQGYEITITGNAKDGYVVTNTNTAKISIPVEKRWIGKSLEEAAINLYADGTKINTVTLNEDNGWKHIFEDLSQYDSRDGHEIVYTVAEDQLNGYEVSIAGNAESGFIVVNKEVKDITITVDDKTDKKTQNKTNNSNKTSSDKQIKTGDSYQGETWVIVGAIAAICIIAIVFKCRNQNKK